MGLGGPSIVGNWTKQSKLIQSSKFRKILRVETDERIRNRMKCFRLMTQSRTANDKIRWFSATRTKWNVNNTTSLDTAAIFRHVFNQFWAFQSAGSLHSIALCSLPLWPRKGKGTWEVHVRKRSQRQFNTHWRTWKIDGASVGRYYRLPTNVGDFSHLYWEIVLAGVKEKGRGMQGWDKEDDRDANNWIEKKKHHETTRPMPQ